MKDSTLLILVLAVALWWYMHHESCGANCGCSSCGATTATGAAAALPATGIPPLPGTGTAQGTQPSLLMKACQGTVKAGAVAVASYYGGPVGGAAAAAVTTPTVTGGFCAAIGKGLVAAEHGVVVGAKDVGKAGAAVGKFVGSETATAAKATAHVTVTAVKDVGSAAKKTVGALSSGAKSAEHAVSSGIHKVLSFL